MTENLGVFDYTELLAEFDNHTDADRYLRDVQENSSYVPIYQDELRVSEIPEDYDRWQKLLNGLRRSRDHDVRVQKAIERLQEARRAAP